MKNVVKTILCLMLSVVMLGSCALADGFTAGTYSVTVPGHNGDVTVEVAFSETVIESIVPVSHQETPGISDGPINTIPQQIIDNQTLAVDTIAGATVTSKALINAVTEAVKLAGGNPETMQTKVEKAAQNAETVTMETDVVVVGAGAAGMITAQSLAEKGYQVLVLEKMSFVGGATLTCGGGLPAVATTELKELGEHTDPAVFAKAIADKGLNLNDQVLTDIFAWQVGPAIDYLRNLGIEIALKTGDSPYSSPYYALHGVTGGGAALAKQLSALNNANQNITTLLNTEATELVVDETGAVTGVKAVAADGKNYEIDAKATVLATGTYSGDKELVDAVYMTNTINTAPVYLTGDGHRMAMAIGAAANHLEWVEGNPNGVATSEFGGKYLNNQTKITSTTGSIIVNQHGVRVMNEESANAAQLAVYAQQDNHALYLVMNENGFAMLHDGGITGWSAPMFSAEDVDNWLAADSLYPVLVMGDTAEEAGNAAGINGAALAETIAHYNEMVAAGADSDFGHAVTETIEGPIYILELRVRHSKVLGGMKADANLNLVREDGSAIKNLYGTGELVSGAQGEVETGMLSWCLASGYYVAEAVNADLK